MTEGTLAAPVHKWLPGPLPAGVKDSLERLGRAEDVAHIAVLPDVHLADDVCVGIALATNRLIYPAAVGSDIGCGMAAIQFDADADLLASEEAAGAVLAELTRCVPLLKHPSAMAPTELPTALRDAPLEPSAPGEAEVPRRPAAIWHTGRGNHFLEFQADEQEQLWLMVHSGSRSMGQAITAHRRGRGERATSTPSGRARQPIERGTGLPVRCGLGHRIRARESVRDRRRGEPFDAVVIWCGFDG